jgi:hypothetical protein
MTQHDPKDVEALVKALHEQISPLSTNVARALAKLEPKPEKPKVIELTLAEIQSGHTRIGWAEDLIRQLPETHEGRNSWLLNYGKKKVKPVYKILEQRRPHWFLEFLDRWAVALTEESADDERNMFDEAWQELLELTATDAPAQKWNMPKWDELFDKRDGYFHFGD